MISPLSNQYKVKILLFRHAESEGNVQVGVLGQSNFTDLTSRGEEQAKLLGKALRLQKINFDFIYTSTAKRTIRTALLSLNEAGIPFQSTKGTEINVLLEQYQGFWEGKKRSELYTTEIIDEMKRLHMNYAAPGGESLFDLQIRATAFLLPVIERAKSLSIQENRVVTIGLFVHYGTVTTLVQFFTKSDPTQTWLIKNENTAITEILFETRGISLVRMNDFSHLYLLPEGLNQTESKGDRITNSASASKTYENWTPSQNAFNLAELDRLVPLIQLCKSSNPTKGTIYFSIPAPTETNKDERSLGVPIKFLNRKTDAEKTGEVDDKNGAGINTEITTGKSLLEKRKEELELKGYKILYEDFDSFAVEPKITFKNKINDFERLSCQTNTKHSKVKFSYNKYQFEIEYIEDLNPLMTRCSCSSIVEKLLFQCRYEKTDKHGAITGTCIELYQQTFKPIQFDDDYHLIRILLKEEETRITSMLSESMYFQALLAHFSL